MCCQHAAFSLDLGCCCGKEVDVEAVPVVGTSSQTPTVGVENRWDVGNVRGERVWRGDVGGADSRSWSRLSDVLVWGWHHGSHSKTVWQTTILDRLLDSLLCLVTPPRVGVVMYPGMAGEFIGTRKSFGAAGELAGMRLLSGMGSDMPRLMLKTVEGLITERTLVRAGQVLSVLAMLASNHGGHHTDSRHFSVSLLLFQKPQFLPRSLLLSLEL